jgi:dolichol kinase
VTIRIHPARPVINLGFDSRRSYSLVKRELFRKLIHIIGFSIPFIAITLGIWFAASFIVALAIGYTISEFLRLRGYSVPGFTAITARAIRGGSESRGTFVKAPLYFAAGILAALLIFPSPISYAAIAVVTLGDGFASIVGKLYGRTKIPFSGGKTMEGTAAGLALAFAGCLIFISPQMSIIAAAVGMGIELLNIRVSDNLSVPLATGLVLTIISAL